MKKAILIFISMSLVIAFSSVIFVAGRASAPAEEKEVMPADKQEEVSAEKKARVKTRQITGEIVALNMISNIITVRKGKNDVVLHLTEKTRVLDGKALADIRISEKVTVKYYEEEGKKIAKSMRIRLKKQRS